MSSTLAKYIFESAERARDAVGEYTFFGEPRVFIKDPLPNNVELPEVLKKIEQLVPFHLCHEVDMIYVGDFDILNQREVNAVWSDGAIYVTNNQESNRDVLDDLVHEIAHACEDALSKDVYADGRIEREFLGKRKKLFDILRTNGYNIDIGSFLNPDFTEKLDSFFYRHVGYPTMQTFTMGLFVSPYAATSLREYFANGFEHYFLGDQHYLKEVCPRLYEKISKIASY